ncbi:MAG: NAD(P)-dependent oxidoreductase [Polyangiaceae bacterium]
MIAFFGMGLLGSSFVRALRKRGEDVHVWNRSHEKAKALEETGAKAFDDPSEAARGALRVHLTLSDDHAVDDVLEKAKEGLSPKTTLVDHSTTSPSGTAARARKWEERGIAFQHAPVFMGPKNALESTGIMLASGDLARFDALAPHLEKMTGKLVYLGAQPERAATMKLLGNLFLISMVGGLRDVLALAKAESVPTDDVVSLFELFNPAASIPARLKSMRRGNFSEASWELSMARKDTRLMIEAAEHAGSPLAVIPTIANEMDRFIAQGHAKDDWTVIAKDVIERVR